MLSEIKQSDDQAARLSQLLRVVVIMALAIGIPELALGLALDNSALVVSGGVGIGAGLFTLLALSVARRGHAGAAVLIMAAMLLAVALLLVVLLPVMVVGMSMIPLLALALLLPYLSSRGVPVAGAACVLMVLIIFLLGELAPLPIDAPSPAVTLLLSCLAVGIVGGLTALLLWQYNARITANIARAEAANAALEESRASLEQQVAARTADLRRALVDMEARAEAQAQLLAQNEEQRDQIREMSVPVLPVNRDTVAIPLIGALDTQRLQVVQEQALTAIERSRAHYLILDVTGVPIVDTQVAQGIVGVVTAARLLGAETVLVGVRPEVAQAVVALGIDLHAITTRQSLFEGIAYADGRRQTADRRPQKHNEHQ